MWFFGKIKSYRTIMPLAGATIRLRHILACLVFIVFVGATFGIQAQDRRKILIIYSYDDLLPWQANIREGLQERLNQIEPAARPDIYEERVDSARFDTAVSGPALTTYLQAKYAALQFDAVITESSAATRILLAHPELFAHAERFAIDPVRPDIGPSQQNPFHIIATQGDWAKKALLTVTQVMPNLTRLIAIVDHSPVGELNRQSLLAVASDLPPTVKLEVWNDFSFQDLLNRSAHLPANSALFYMPVFRDNAGGHLTPRSVVQSLVNASTAPVFAEHDTFLGTGIVGGRLLSSRRAGNMIADLALGSGYAEKWADAEALLNPFIFDDAALKRWNISMDRLPVPYVLSGREEPVWHQYRWQIGAAFAALLVEGLLILALITALKQRKLAINAVILERDRLELRVSERTQELLAATHRLEENNVRLAELANTDALTSLANRRKFLDVAEVEMVRAKLHDRPMSFLMIDIDNFKSINDRYGHAAGDMVIRAIADACRAQVRATDCVGRMGGEEFAILLPEIGFEEACAGAERIREIASLLQIDLKADASIKVTMSIGVSALLGSDDTLDDLAGRADAALYQAKRQGRNRVVGNIGGDQPAEPVADPLLRLIRS